MHLSAASDSTLLTLKYVSNSTQERGTEVLVACVAGDVAERVDDKEAKASTAAGQPSSHLSSTFLLCFLQFWLAGAALR
jgi:hypothetical protein